MLSRRRDRVLATYQESLDAMGRSDFAKAIAGFHKTIDLGGPKIADAHWHLAICYFRTQRYSQAAHQYQSFLDLRPEEDTQHFREFIACLQSTEGLEVQAASKSVEEFLKKEREQQAGIRLAGREYTLKEVLVRFGETMSTVAMKPHSPFRGMTGNNHIRVPSSYAARLFTDLDVGDVYAMCDEMQRAGVVSALVLCELEGHTFTKVTAKGDRRLWTPAELSRRSPWNWYFVSSLLDNVASIVTHKLATDFPSLREHQKRFEEHVVRDFVLEGFSLALDELIPSESNK